MVKMLWMKEEYEESVTLYLMVSIKLKNLIKALLGNSAMRLKWFILLPMCMETIFHNASNLFAIRCDTH